MFLTLLHDANSGVHHVLSVGLSRVPQEYWRVASAYIPGIQCGGGS